jgi:hypothetical protein
MSKVFVSMGLSLDGYVAGPNRSLQNMRGAFFRAGRSPTTRQRGRGRELLAARIAMLVGR